MANPNPHKARAAKRKKQQPGDIGAVRRLLWEAIETAGAIAADPDAKPELRLRGVHAVTQASASYTRLLEATEFEARLRALEDELGNN